MTLFMVLLGQIVFAIIVIVVLKKLLEKELYLAAVEKFETCKVTEGTKEITIRSASVINDEFKSYFEIIQKRRMPQVSLNFEIDGALKGGVVIVIGDQVFDFSLANRLEHFWS